MNPITNIAIWMLVVEVTLTVLFVLSVYVMKVYQFYTSKDKVKLGKAVEKVMHSSMKNNKALSHENVMILKKDILLTLQLAENEDKKSNGLPGWERVRSMIIQDAFLPTAKKYYKSRSIYKRYCAAKLFNYHFNEEDAPLVVKLIKDPVLFVAVRASRVGFKFSSNALIGAAIDTFSKGRNKEQSILSSIAANYGKSVETIISARLLVDVNPYIKAFCYRLLMQFPASKDLSDTLESDLNSDVLNLKLAALRYAGHNPAYQPLICQYLNDPRWEVRAVAANLIGIIKDESCIEALGKALSDAEWWVRIRAAQSLGELGEKGINMLKAQSIEKDQYAYEAAEQILIFHSHEKGAI